MASLGRHLLVEMWDCDSRIDDVETIGRAIDEAVVAIGATLVQSHVHRYSPQGVTGLAVLAESHLSLHSWPEYGYLAADVFTCGTLTIPRRAVAVFEKIFAPGRIEVQEIERGVQVGEAALPKTIGSRVAHPTV
ncbi:MAG TPA: adenosylmethionine decarboxylase [Planctomycetaceae bacterium]|nr:adenosylmethionine decarboxylase [Planctomycetaceae bacterium]|tara:strand:+ start:1270 stop:1671 length:402 start_codon:yes stop_codon:yes gene_type:complete